MVLKKYIYYLSSISRCWETVRYVFIMHNLFFMLIFNHKIFGC